MPVELTEKLLSDAAGWEAMKRARSYVLQDQVLSSDWAPPLLRGVVQAGELSFRAGLVIQGPIDIENVCTCRDSREWGKICAHSIAVGLHWLNARKRDQTAVNASPFQRPGSAPQPTPDKGKRLRREAGGEPAELFVVLPPNFAEAATRGKVMLVLEASWRKGRMPLNALPTEEGFAFSTPDARIIERLEELAGETPGMLVLETASFVGLLPALVGHPRITLGRNTAVEVDGTPLGLPLRAMLDANGEIVVSLQADTSLLEVLGGEWVWKDQRLQPLGLPTALHSVLQRPMRISRAQVPTFLSQLWPQLSGTPGAEANFRPDDFVLEPRAPKFLLELKGGLAQLTALLQCRYGHRILTNGAGRRDESRSSATRDNQNPLASAAADETWLPDPESPTRYSTRDFGAERAALARLQRAGFNGPDAQGRLQLLGQNAILNFFARDFPTLQRAWEVTLEDRLQRSTQQNLERIEPRFQISSSGVQWFDLGVVFESSGGERFSAADIQRLVLGGQNQTRLKNGKIALLDTGAVEELQKVLLDCAPQQHAAGYRIENTQAGFLEATLKQRPEWKVQAPSAWLERAARQAGETKLECPPLGALESVLRPYQKEGVAWLHFLRENGFGGILADEMGLGKTLQALAFLQSKAGCPVSSNPRPAQGQPDDKPDTCPALVVCPTSLVWNWVAEARRFTPQLDVLALHGPERHALFAEIPRADLVVTSYALIRRDAEQYQKLEFDTVILDEAQHIKNRQTQNAQAVKSVRSRHRLVLTGTPLENSVLDLWSIFDFLMPGYLGSAQDFRERYEIPIARERNDEAQKRLGRRLRPFILRRVKREVAKDLPPKLEQISFCELTEEQRAVYQQVIEASRKEVLDAVGAQGLARSRMVVLNALLRLRQVCCDLRLLKLEPPVAAQASPPAGSGAWPVGTRARGLENPPNLQTESSAPPPSASSGKLDLFGELLEEVLDGGHRVLVFSQFTSMLALLKERLSAEGIEFCYLDGSTANRAEVVERFQKTASIPVFLISLKAGGVGLNLSGADTVIHFDPWWNPAVEDQASDRAHRIGQTRVVTSYKLITRGTVEEKILQLQQRKREVIRATIGDEAQFTEALTWEEIQGLLA